jgi:prepilin-type N-terminal cleavage/methylation domain-containing protein
MAVISGAAGSRGFTLIELLLVLVVFGLAAALVAPRFHQFYLRLLFWFDQDGIERELAGIGAEAYLKGRTLTLASWPPPPGAADAEVQGERVTLSLRQGWRVVVDPTIVFRPDGACTGGHVTIVSGERMRVLRLDPPRCRPR